VHAVSLGSVEGRGPERSCWRLVLRLAGIMSLVGLALVRAAARPSRPGGNLSVRPYEGSLQSRELADVVEVAERVDPVLGDADDGLGLADRLGHLG
jgi:hypothetical protein